MNGSVVLQPPYTYMHTCTHTCTPPPDTQIGLGTQWSGVMGYKETLKTFQAVLSWPFWWKFERPESRKKVDNRGLAQEVLGRARTLF